MPQAFWSLNWHLNKTTLSPLCATPEVVKPTPCHWLALYPSPVGKSQGWMETGDHHNLTISFSVIPSSSYPQSFLA